VPTIEPETASVKKPKKGKSEINNDFTEGNTEAGGLIMKNSIEDTIIFHLSIPGELVERIDDFKFEKRIVTRAAAMRYLMTWALNRLHKPNNGS